DAESRRRSRRGVVPTPSPSIESAPWPTSLTSSTPTLVSSVSINAPPGTMGQPSPRLVVPNRPELRSDDVSNDATQCPAASVLSEGCATHSERAFLSVVVPSRGPLADGMSASAAADPAALVAGEWKGDLHLYRTR